MRLLTALALWAGISFPLGMLAGRLLHRHSATVADEADDYLRSRAPWRRRLGWPGAIAAVSALTVGVVVGNEAAERLPAAHLAATRGIDRLTGADTTTTTAPGTAAQVAPEQAEPAPAMGARGPRPSGDRQPPGERISESPSSGIATSTTGTGPGQGGESGSDDEEGAVETQDHGRDRGAARADEARAQSQGRRPPVSDDRRDAAQPDASSEEQPTTSTTEAPSSTSTTSTTESTSTTSTTESPSTTSTTESPSTTSTSTTEPPQPRPGTTSTTAAPGGDEDDPEGDTGDGG